MTQGWQRYVGDRGEVIGVDRFGASAPGPMVKTFLAARFSGAERHRRRLAKVAELENKVTRS